MVVKCINRNKLIGLYSSSIDNQSYDFKFLSKDYTLLLEMWANITTKNPYTAYFGVSSAENNITHIFNVRYDINVIPFLENQNSILYENILYEVVNFLNKDEENKQIEIFAIKQGKITLPILDGSINA